VEARVTAPPTADDWRFASGFSPERLANLERTTGFEEIGEAIVREAQVTALPMETGAAGELRGCRRPVFRLVVAPATFDQFYNGRDGYRARYWQSPEAGEAANRWLLRALSPKLVGALGKPDAAFGQKSLACGSATIWFREETTLGNARLQVAQWEAAARGDSTLSDKAREARWAPIGTLLEIKGAFLTDGYRERIDPDTVERAMTLHHAGFV
jgi:hypothetical protein